LATRKTPRNSGRILSSIHSNVDHTDTKGTIMEFVSVRVITGDVERLAAFWEQVTGLPAARPAPVFAELRTPAGTIAIGAPATVAVLGDAAPSPGQNHSALIELRVDDVDAVRERALPASPPRSCSSRPTCPGATAR
jgi:predicted enzyme related to lactoylglutathione lyase